MYYCLNVPTELSISRINRLSLNTWTIKKIKNLLNILHNLNSIIFFKLYFFSYVIKLLLLLKLGVREWNRDRFLLSANSIFHYDQISIRSRLTVIYFPSDIYRVRTGDR